MESYNSERSMRRSFPAACCLIMLCACLCALAVTYAWLGGTNKRDVPINSGVILQYFEQGSGTQDDPFIIHTPVHLYNLAWLQDMGKFQSQKYYFMVCNAGDNTFTGSDGTTKTITCIHPDSRPFGDPLIAQITIPPIGTSTYPFIGSFDGNGQIIQGVKIATSGWTNDPELSGWVGCGSSIGFFGQIGSGTETGVAVKDLYLDQLTVDSGSVSGTSGLAAGYVNAAISGIGISNSTLNAGTSGSSVYTLVGDADSSLCSYAGVAERKLEEVTYPADGYATVDSTELSYLGLGNAWGDSIDMETMYTNLVNLKNNAVQQYIKTEQVTVYGSDPTSLEVSSVFSRGSTTLGQRNGYNLVNYYGDNGGVSATIVDRTDTNNYMYLTEASNTTKQLTIHTVTGTDDENSKRIGDASGHFLTVTVSGSSRTIANTDTENDATVWIIDEENHSIYYTESGGSEKYYLNCDNSGALSVGTTQNTAWNIGTNTISCELAGETGYLHFDSNGILLYSSSDSASAYLSVSSSGISTTTEKASAAEWHIDGTSIYYLNGTTRQYLSFNDEGALILSTAAYSWVIGDSDVSATSPTGTQYQYTVTYIGTWTVSQKVVKYYIRDTRGNYLSTDGSVISNQTSASGATLWDSRSGKVCTTIGTTVYYLDLDQTNLPDKQLNLKISASAGVSWINDGASLYCKVNYLDNSATPATSTVYTYFIGYDTGSDTASNTWVASRPADAVRKISCTVGGSVKYLTVVPDTSTTNPSYSISTTTNKDSACDWIFSASESGLCDIYTEIGDGDPKTKLYLRHATYALSSSTLTQENSAYGADIVFVSASPQADLPWHWEESGTGAEIYYVSTYTDSSGSLDIKYYLSCTGASWGIQVPRIWYIISQYDTSGVQQYMTDSTESSKIKSTTAESGAAKWYFSDMGSIRSPSGSIQSKSSNPNKYLNYATETGTVLYIFSVDGYYANLRLTDVEIEWSRNDKGIYKAVAWSWKRATGSTDRYITYTKSHETSFWGLSGTEESDATSKVITTPGQDSVLLGSEVVIVSPPEAYTIASEGIPTLLFRTAQSSSTEDTTKTPLSATTYFPLSTVGDFPYAASPANTGYVISGNSESSSYKADIRVSKYGITSISKSITNNSYSASTAKIYACANNTDSTYGTTAGSFSLLYDESTNKYLATTDGQLKQDQMSALGFTQYNNAKLKLDALLTGKSYIYGLHFMNATISADRFINATKVVLNGETYVNYPLPKDCIDVKMKTAGHITLFAGTYYSGNNTFFSLHQITRNSDPKNPISIREISAIYLNDNGNYVYQYKNGAAPSGTLVFDLAWLTSPSGLEENTLYYYEIPVSEGEYAVGSVSGGTGSYLIYLDLSANAKEIVKKTVTTTETVTASVYEYPDGVDIVSEPGQDIGCTPAATLQLLPSTTSGAAISRTEATTTDPTTVFYTPSATAAASPTSSYIARLDTFDSGSGAGVLPVNQVISRYGKNKDDFPLPTKSNPTAYLSWIKDSTSPITDEAQNSDTDVTLKSASDDSKITATPIEYTCRKTVTTYADYYVKDSSTATPTYTLVYSTKDNPETTVEEFTDPTAASASLASASLNDDSDGATLLSSADTPMLMSFSPAFSMSSTISEDANVPSEDSSLGTIAEALPEETAEESSEETIEAEAEQTVDSESEEAIQETDNPKEELQSGDSVWVFTEVSESDGQSADSAASNQENYNLEQKDGQLPEYVLLAPIPEYIPPEETTEEESEETTILREILNSMTDEDLYSLCTDENIEPMREALQELGPDSVQLTCDRVMQVEDSLKRAAIRMWLQDIADSIPMELNFQEVSSNGQIIFSVVLDSAA